MLPIVLDSNLSMNNRKLTDLPRLLSRKAGQRSLNRIAGHSISLKITKLRCIGDDTRKPGLVGHCRLFCVTRLVLGWFGKEISLGFLNMCMPMKRKT